jgi:putative endonuclease
MYIVYILKSLKETSKYYIGLTEDLDRRLNEHNSGITGYSKRYAPWQVETYVVFRNRLLAVEFEK